MLLARAKQVSCYRIVELFLVLKTGQIERTVRASARLRMRSGAWPAASAAAAC
jgi:hypothetical protein